MLFSDCWPNQWHSTALAIGGAVGSSVALLTTTKKIIGGKLLHTALCLWQLVVSAESVSVVEAMHGKCTVGN